jgi:hypothetical protein
VAKPEELKKGVEVWIKNPAHIYAEVIGPRRGDGGLPPKEVTYKVRILPAIQYLPSEGLELVHPPKDPKARLEYMSSDWVKELRNLNDVAARFLANNDANLATQVNESMAKLGFLAQRD